MIEELTCDHKHNRPCYRIFSNGSEHVGYQCVRCGRFKASKKDEWLKIYIRESNGPYEEEIVSEWRELQRQHFFRQTKNNRETVLDDYYSSPEWERKRSARLELNRHLFAGKCEICLEAPATQCHHATYARFRNEWLLDLIAVCSWCHQSQHEHMQDQ
jgi:hypothetical protein